jgi:hypothetical protein
VPPLNCGVRSNCNSVLYSDPFRPQNKSPNMCSHKIRSCNQYHLITVNTVLISSLPRYTDRPLIVNCHAWLTYMLITRLSFLRNQLPSFRKKSLFSTNPASGQKETVAQPALHHHKVNIHAVVFICHRRG